MPVQDQQVNIRIGKALFFNLIKGRFALLKTKPVKRAPAAIKRDTSRIFVTFRPNENIGNEISVTSGHKYKTSSVTARSGKNNFSFFSQDNFAWLLDEREKIIL